MRNIEMKSGSRLTDNAPASTNFDKNYVKSQESEVLKDGRWLGLTPKTN
jgi:hypothetical protein